MNDFFTKLVCCCVQLCVKKNYYDLFVPFGRSCHCRMHLSACGLIKFSSPFDWLIPYDYSIEPIQERFDLLNNFNEFFNIADYQFYLDKISNTNHYLAINKKYKFEIGHEFELGISNEENLKKIKNKYMVRYHRLVSAIKNSKKICFVYMVNTWTQMGATSELNLSVVKTELFKLRNKYPTTNFDFIIFEHSKKMKRNKIERIELDENIVKYLSNHTFLSLSDNEWQKHGNKMPNLSPTLTIRNVLKSYNLL